MVDLSLAPIPAREVRPAPNPPAALTIRLTYEDRFILQPRLMIHSILSKTMLRRLLIS